MTKIQMVAQKVADRGTSSPCVARTALQTEELLAGMFLDKTIRDQIIGVSFAVMRRLSALEDIAERVEGAVAGALKLVAREGVDIQAHGRAVNLPSVPALRDDAELFLYTAKLALRDIASLFQPFFAKAFDHQYHQVRAWLEKEFGSDDPLLVLLNEDRVWIERIINMRNVIEHPTDSHGPITIRDFTLAQGETLTVVPPTWFLQEELPALIADEMRAICTNLLTFYEDLVMDGLNRLDTIKLSEIVEIPVDERDPQFPKRLRRQFRFLRAET